MLENLKLSTRILLVGLVPLLCVVFVLTWVQLRMNHWVYEAKSEKTMHLVQSAWGVLDFYGSQARAGRMTAEQAQDSAKQALKNLRYGNNDYFWINDLGPRMIMHPINPAMDGQDLTGYEDPDGLRLFVKAVEVCTRRGEGAIQYRWVKPGTSVPVPKTSFVKLYEPWGWIVGSGIYVDDVQAQLLAMVIALILDDNKITQCRTDISLFYHNLCMHILQAFDSLADILFGYLNRLCLNFYPLIIGELNLRQYFTFKGIALLAFFFEKVNMGFQNGCYFRFKKRIVHSILNHSLL